MARIAGVDLPRKKRIDIALTYLYGIGRMTSAKILDELSMRPEVRAKDLSDEEVARLATHIDDNYIVEGVLRRAVLANINRMKDIACYRGLRHRRGLPVHGQRTRCNARSRKGPRKTVANKKILRK